MIAPVPRGRSLRVILDTNVLLSGIFFGGVPGRILAAWQDELALSPTNLAEYHDAGAILAARYAATETPLDAILALLTQTATIVDAPDLRERVSGDPADDKFLACAIAAQVPLIVSGDKHLLAGWTRIAPGLPWGTGLTEYVVTREPGDGAHVNKSRFEAFSDGVFAFAITLLVLGFSLPPLREASDGELTAALLRLWPNLIAYALSFGVIGIMWQNHHALFRLVHRVDRTTVFLNLLLLGGTAFIPFATSTLGAYPLLHSSTLLYGLTLSWTATAYNVMLMHLVRSHAFGGGVTDATLAPTIRAYRTGWTVYAAATLLALWIPLLSFAAYIGIAVYYLVPRGIDADIETSSAS